MAHIGPMAVIIDFSEFPESYKRIEDEAKRNFRTLTNEILFRLVR
jgi:hypothetical protein